MTNMTTLLLLRRRSSVPLPRSRCLATLNSSGNLANSTSSTNLSFISASKQYVHSSLGVLRVWNSYLYSIHWHFEECTRGVGIKQSTAYLLDSRVCTLYDPQFSFSSLSFLKLLEKKKRVQLKDMGEDLECLCQIMRTVGPRLDHEKAKVTTPALNPCNCLNRLLSSAWIFLCGTTCPHKYSLFIGVQVSCAVKCFRK